MLAGTGEKARPSEHLVDTLLFVGIVAAVVALGSFEWVIIGVGLSLIFVAARTNAVPPFLRWRAEQRRQRQAEIKGLEAELRIKDQLEEAGFPVLHNVFLPHPDGSGALTQIDLIALSWQGIEVIEVKAHEGFVNVEGRNQTLPKIDDDHPRHARASLGMMPPGATRPAPSSPGKRCYTTRWDVTPFDNSVSWAASRDMALHHILLHRGSRAFRRRTGTGVRTPAS